MSKTIALDAKKSVRSYDDNGHLKIARTVITKADVNDYYGREIPGFEDLGLSPDKIYSLLRCPEEIKSAMDSFAGKQLLIKHTPVNSAKPEPSLTVGSIGSKLEFEDDKLYADLTFWDDSAIDMVESEVMQELSAGYAYTPDMQPGIFNGKKYDGVMRNLKGNHVALVERGRIGVDAVIGDSQTIPDEGKSMKVKPGARKRINQMLTQIAQDGLGRDSVDEVVEAVLEEHRDNDGRDVKLEEVKKIIGDDDKFDEVVKLLGGVAGDESHDDKKRANDEDDGEKARRERRELEETDRDDREAKRDDKDEEIRRLREKLESLERKAEDNSHALDANSIARDVEARVNAKFKARDEVESLVGTIAMDSFSSADEIYAYALDAKGVDTKGVNSAGLRNMVRIVSNQQKPVAMANDSAVIKKSQLTERFTQR